MTPACGSAIPHSAAISATIAPSWFYLGFNLEDKVVGYPNGERAKKLRKLEDKRPSAAAKAAPPTPVRYEGPAIAQQYRAVRIMCGGQQLAEITDIVTAQ